MSLHKTPLRHKMLSAVGMHQVTVNTERGAWVGPEYRRRMGCYEWADGKHMTVVMVRTLIELRDASLIVTVPVPTARILAVKTTPLGGCTLTSWFRAAVTS